MKKKGIANQIQTRIGKSVGIIFVIVAIVVVVLTHITITEANDTELKLESEAAAYQLADFFDEYRAIAESMTTNVQIQEYMNTTRTHADIRVNINFSDVMKAMKGVQALHPDTIMAAWIADSDASCIVMSDGYVSDESFQVSSRPWYKCTTDFGTLIPRSAGNLKTLI